MKKIGFLSFGHWSPSPHSQTRSASDALLQSIDLAVAAEELGADGAYFRVHHFARQLASPFPLLAAIGARTSRIEIGTGVIDMRYENPLYMAEDAGAADLIAGGRLQLGISRGSPEQVIDGFRYFGYVPAEGSDHADDGARARPGLPRGDPGRGVRRAEPAADVPEPARAAAHRAALARAARPDLVGCRHPRHGGVDGRAGHEPDELDPAHRGHRRAVPPAAGRADPACSATPGRRPATRASRGSRSAAASSRSSTTWTAPTSARSPAARTRSATSTAAPPRFGKTYAGEPDRSSSDLAEDEAVAAADTLLLTVPNQLGVDYNAHVLESVLRTRARARLALTGAHSGSRSPRPATSAAGAVSRQASNVSSASSSRSTPASRTTTQPNPPAVNWISNVSGRSATSASCSAMVCLRPTVRVGSQR